MSSGYENAQLAKVFEDTQRTIASGASSVFDVRGRRGLVVHLNGGTATYQPCDAAGAVVPGSAAKSVTSGTLIDPDWTHFVVVASGAACTGAAV